MVFLPIIIAGLIAFFASFLLCMLMRKTAAPLGLIDITGREARKDHKGKPALVGGAAIFVSSIVVCSFWFPSFQMSVILPMFWGMGMYLGLGMYDDMRNIPALIKLGLQILIAIIAVKIFDLKLYNLGHLHGNTIFSLGDLASIFSVLCIIVYINAFNLIDGIDGLSGSVAVSTMFLCGLIAIPAEIIPIQDGIFILAMAIAGFLALNLRSPLRKKAIIFLGDGGSLSVSFAIAWTAITLANEYSVDETLPSPVIYTFLLAYPIFDMLSVMVNRFNRGLSIFAPDTNHMHHLLKKAGLRIRYITPLLTALSLTYALYGLALWKLQIRQDIVVILWLVLLLGHFWIYRMINQKLMK